MGSTGYSNANQHYYPQPAATVQDRFSPMLLKDQDHTGDVLPAASQDSFVIVNPENNIAQSSLASDLPFQNSLGFPPSGQGSDTISVQEDPPANSGSNQNYYTPPPLPSGYDHPSPPPPPPDSPRPSYYYPPPPNKQYLPAPTTTPLNPPPPPPTPPPATYTYYYLGPKLWYIPMFFNVYCVFYLAYLIIRVVAKHKVLFPEHLYAAASSVAGREDGFVTDQLKEYIVQGLKSAASKYIVQGSYR